MDGHTVSISVGYKRDKFSVAMLPFALANPLAYGLGMLNTKLTRKSWHFRPAVTPLACLTTEVRQEMTHHTSMLHYRWSDYRRSRLGEDMAQTT